MKKLILNQKSFLNYDEVIKFKKELESINNGYIVLFPSLIYLSLFKDSSLDIGTQNFYTYEYGEYTGQINLKSLEYINVEYTFVNHDEAKEHGCEDKKLIRSKLLTSLTNNFKTILFVGENKYMDSPFSMIKSELDYMLKDIDIKYLGNLSIMYEPTWLTDEPDINMIRKVIIDIKEYFINKYKMDIEVYYAGLVDINNMNEILKYSDGIGLGKKSIDIKYVKNVIDKMC